MEQNFLDARRRAAEVRKELALAQQQARQQEGQQEVRGKGHISGTHARAVVTPTPREGRMGARRPTSMVLMAQAVGEHCCHPLASARVGLSMG
jgi:hypothetical protein